MSLPTDKLEVMAGISHEIRNPLNAIIGITNLLQNKNSEEERKELLATLLQSSESLLEITNNILDFSKLESGELRYTYTGVDIRRAIPRALFGQRRIAEAKGLDLSIHFDEAVPEAVILDRVKFSQIIINLVSNAIKFTETGGIRVNIEVMDISDEKVCLRCSVKDTGIGIPEEKIKTVFKPFRQASGAVNLKYGGTGLGLSISKKLTEDMGGKLQVKSEPDQGSEFSFMLDLDLSEEPEQIGVPVEANQDQLPKHFKILAVDDNRINLLVVSKHMKNWGLDFETAEDGADALAKIQEEHFDLILMDLNMPKMDGFEATHAIRKHSKSYSEIPIIALTGSTGVMVREKTEAGGFTDFVNKPIQPRDLLEKIVSAAQKSLLQENVIM